MIEKQYIIKIKIIGGNLAVINIAIVFIILVGVFFSIKKIYISRKNGSCISCSGNCNGCKSCEKSNNKHS